MTIQEWITEAEMYEYSADNYNMTKLLGEIELTEMAIRSYELIQSNTVYTEGVELLNVFNEAEEADGEVKKAKEGLGAKIKKAWQWLVNKLKSIWGAIVSFFTGTKKKAKAVEEKAEKVEAVVERALESVDMKINKGTKISDETKKKVQSMYNEMINDITNNRGVTVSGLIKNVTADISTKGGKNGPGVKGSNVTVTFEKFCGRFDIKPHQGVPKLINPHLGILMPSYLLEPTKSGGVSVIKSLDSMIKDVSEISEDSSKKKINEFVTHIAGLGVTIDTIEADGWKTMIGVPYDKIDNLLSELDSVSDKLEAAKRTGIPEDEEELSKALRTFNGLVVRLQKIIAETIRITNSSMGMRDELYSKVASFVNSAQAAIG